MFSKRAVWPLFFLLAACGRKPPAGPEHIAVLRFENLGGEASSGWMGRAFSEIIAWELPAAVAIPSNRIHAVNRGLGIRPASAPGISTERDAALLAGANRIVYGEYAERNGRISARLTVEDPATGRDLATYSASGAGVLQVAGDLARQLSPNAGPYQTTNPEALRHYITALDSSDPSAMQQGASAAIALDPDFGPPYRLLADAKIAQHDRDGALAALDSALARTTIEPLERARIELDAAALRNDFAARQHALADLAKSSPGDIESWRSLAETAYARHDYPAAGDAYRRLLQLDPNDVAALNEFGYTQANLGDFDGALRTFQRYRSLHPNDANAIDSTGDIYLMYGRLQDAEKLYLEADRKNRNLLGGGDILKAAMARLMSGDVPGASALATQYAGVRSSLHDPGVPIFQAEWARAAGDHESAARQLQALTSGPLASRAFVDLAIWSLLDGDRAAAAQWAAKAQATANDATAVQAIIARFLSQPSAPAAEWNGRAEQLFRNAQQPELKQLTLAYAYLLDRDFGPAAETLRRLYASPTTDPGLPVLLAWSLIESGHKEEAAPLLRFNPIPQPNGIGPFFNFYFPRFFSLRGSPADLETFRKLGGR